MRAPDDADDESESEDEDEDTKAGCDADGIKAAELSAPASERAGAGAADAGRCDRDTGR